MNISLNDTRLHTTLWSLLLLTAVLVAWPVYADDESNISGRIQEISLSERFIVVGGVKYTIPLNAELILVAGIGDNQRVISMSELERRQYIDFQFVNDNIIKSLRAYEKLPQ